MAEIKGNTLSRLTSNRVFGLDDLTSEGDALTTLRLAAERAIGLGRTVRAATSGVTNVALTNGIADTDDHHWLPLLRVVRYMFCDWFAIVMLLPTPQSRYPGAKFCFKFC